MKKNLKIFFLMLLRISSYHSWNIIVNNISRICVGLVNSVLSNAINNYGIVQNFPGRLFGNEGSCK